MTQISQALKIKEDIILGISALIFKYKESKDAFSFLYFAASLNKVKENKVHLIYKIY